MFIRKSKVDKLLKENMKLQARVDQLEDLICPCDDHDWKEVLTPSSTDQIKYVCKKCRKVFYKPILTAKSQSSDEFMTYKRGSNE